MKRASVGFALAVLVLSLALAACGSSKKASTTTTESTKTAAASESKETSSAGAVSAASVELGAKYIGGTAGKANASESPVVVGLTVQEGGVPGFPEMKAASTAAANFINNDLGGIKGHPVKFSYCVITAEEDGQKCAGQFLNEKLAIANQSLAVVGNAPFYDTIAGKFPVINTVSSSGPDYSTPDVYVMDGGGSSILWAMARKASELGKSTSVASIGSGNPGGKNTAEKVLLPQLHKEGVKVTNVFYSDTVTTPGILSALEAAGVQKAGVVLLDPSAADQCIGVYESLKQLGLKTPVVTTPICNSDAFVEKTGAGPEGWFIYSYVTNPRVESDAEVKMYREVMTAEKFASDITTGFASQQFAQIITIAKIANVVGPANLSPTSYTTAIKGFRGPAFMTPGTLYCGYNANKENISLCGNAVTFATFEKVGG